MGSLDTQNQRGYAHGHKAPSVPPQGVALEPTPILHRLEQALRDLHPRQELYVDTAGGIHRDKQPFLAGEVSALVSFRAEEPGIFTVYSGILPRLDTYCQSGADTQALARERTPLQYSAVMRSGDLIEMGPDFSFTIPSRRVLEVQTGRDKLTEIITNAGVGDRVSLGRSSAKGLAGIPNTVSRVHVTAEVVSSATAPNGSLDIIVRVFPGILGTVPVLLERGSEEKTLLTNATLLASGSRLFLGELGALTLPHPENSLDDVASCLSVCFEQRNAQGAESLLQSMRVGSVVHSFSEAAAKRDAAQVQSSDVVLRAKTLELYIKSGLTLIQNGDYGAAIERFRDSGVLNLLGYRFEENHVFRLDVISPNAILDNLRRVASDSWFRIDEKLVYPSFGMLKRGLEPSNDEERRLLDRWRKEVALIYAEEYTHALQDARGRLVSRKAALLGAGQHEADVALFFAENGVSLSYEFGTARYPERELALMWARGLQSPGEAAVLRDLIRETPLGGSFRVGRNVQRADPGRPGLSISREPAPHLSPEENSVRAMARAEVRSVEALIVKSSDGSFAITPVGESALCKVFVPDEFGYYAPLRQGRKLAPGTPIYLGRAFRFVLE